MHMFTQLTFDFCLWYVMCMMCMYAYMYVCMYVCMCVFTAEVFYMFISKHLIYF